MTEPKQPSFKKGFLFGIRTGERNKTYTLSVDACCPAEAIAELKNALVALEEGRSHFASGENNVMMIGNVSATERRRSSGNMANQFYDNQQKTKGTSIPHENIRSFSRYKTKHTGNQTCTDDKGDRPAFIPSCCLYCQLLKTAKKPEATHPVSLQHAPESTRFPWLSYDALERMTSSEQAIIKLILHSLESHRGHRFAP